MSLFVNTNVASLNAQRNLFNNTMKVNSSLEKLSSGLRINRAGDGAGDLLASESLRSQIRGTQAANRNIQQGIAMLDMADGGMQAIYENLQRIREIAVEAGNTGVTYAPYNAEINGLRTAIDQIANNTEFNGQDLLNGPAGNFFIQFGANSGQSLDIIAAFDNVTTAAAGLNLAAAAIASPANAQAYLVSVDASIDALATSIATVGATRNTLAGQLTSNQVAVENLTAAEATIRNTDVAAESANLIKSQVLQQASAIALAQANQAPSIALTLLQGL